MLSEYLDSDLSLDDCMGLSDLDGFLTGVVVSPELIMPSGFSATMANMTLSVLAMIGGSDFMRRDQM